MLLVQYSVYVAQPSPSEEKEQRWRISAWSVSHRSSTTCLSIQDHPPPTRNNKTMTIMLLVYKIKESILTLYSAMRLTVSTQQTFFPSFVTNLTLLCEHEATRSHLIVCRGTVRCGAVWCGMYELFTNNNDKIYNYYIIDFTIQWCLPLNESTWRIPFSTNDDKSLKKGKRCTTTGCGNDSSCT